MTNEKRKEQMRKYSQEWYKRNKEHKLEYQRWYDNRPELKLKKKIENGDLIEC